MFRQTFYERTNLALVQFEAHIVLPEDASKDSQAVPLPVRHTGDIIGTLEVTTNSDAAFEVDLVFEGVIRTWAVAQSTVGLTKELQFLRQVQNLKVNQCVRDATFQANRAHVSFKFTIPNQLISIRSDVHPDFLGLCPSTNISRTFENALCFFHARQPWINYCIKISSVRADNLIPSVLSSRAREVPIVPFSYAAPPVEPDHHPQQYRCASTKALKKMIFGRLYGKLTLSAKEPAPINLFTESPRASGIVILRVTLSPENQFHAEPSQWGLVVKSRLRTRTFTTIRRLPRAPTSMTGQTDPFLHMEEEKEKWEVRDYGLVSWRSEQLEGDEGALRPLWTSEVKVPVSVSKDSLPTFLNLLSARQYAIVLRVSISELPSCKGLELVIPVQLIYHRQDKKKDEHRDFAFSNQDDSQCLISDNSLPPTYTLL